MDRYVVWFEYLDWNQHRESNQLVQNGIFHSKITNDDKNSTFIKFDGGIVTQLNYTKIKKKLSYREKRLPTYFGFGPTKNDHDKSFSIF